MVLSLLLGFAIGFERKMRFKEAGIRTHTIVCVGSCLFTIVSIFGFSGVDSSRIAAQIVSGIGFIGAGMIFYHKEMVRGLTTAAGIWATAAIGMAAGSGMYLICVVATSLIIAIQCIMHLNIKLFHSKHFYKMNIIFKDNGQNTSKQVLELFGVSVFENVSIRQENDIIVYNVMIVIDRIISADEIRNIIVKNPYIVSINRKNSEF